MPYWDVLQQAVYEDRCIRVLYENHSHDIAERVLEPYSLVAKSSFWYLVAKRESDMRTYRVSRLQMVELLDETFTRDPGFDLAAYWQSHLSEFTTAMAGYEFMLRIDESRLNFVRWLTPGRCEIVDFADETGWLTVRLSVETPELAQMLVFGLGDQGEVIAPKALDEAVLAAARDVLVRYNERRE
jgi:predicted DNA-binding transcriptional regulator YafY